MDRPQTTLSAMSRSALNPKWSRQLTVAQKPLNPGLKQLQLTDHVQIRAFDQKKTQRHCQKHRLQAG